MEGFHGVTYRTAENWKRAIPVENRPIKYAEVGCFYGANLISVANTYASHPDSKMYAIDPWMDYAEYSEYKNEQPSIYDAFCKNIVNCGVSHKIKVIRDFSHQAFPRLEDDSFDMIYVDGNHNPEYVLEDGVLAFRKLKVGGYLIFDDYGWGGPDMVQRGIDAFLSGYAKRIRILGNFESQIIVKKLN